MLRYSKLWNCISIQLTNICYRFSKPMNICIKTKSMVYSGPCTTRHVVTKYIALFKRTHASSKCRKLRPHQWYHKQHLCEVALYGKFTFLWLDRKLYCFKFIFSELVEDVCGFSKIRCNRKAIVNTLLKIFKGSDFQSHIFGNI